MSAVQHSIVSVSAADLRTLAQFMFASQLAQATNRFLFNDWPAETAQVSLYLSSLEQSLKDPCREMFKVVDNASGDIIGSLILVRQGPEKSERASLEETSPASLPVGMNPEVLSVLKRMLATVQREMVGIDHFVLSSIFVKSSSRVKGIGSQLVRICINKASDAKVPLFLSSVPSARGFYLKQGFKDTTHADIDLSKWGPEYCGFGVYRLFGMLLSD